MVGEVIYWAFSMSFSFLIFAYGQTRGSCLYMPGLLLTWDLFFPFTLGYFPATVEKGVLWSGLMVWIHGVFMVLNFFMLWFGLIHIQYSCRSYVPYPPTKNRNLSQIGSSP